MMQNRPVLLLPVGAILLSVIALYYPSLLAGYSKAIVPPARHRHVLDGDDTKAY